VGLAIEPHAAELLVAAVGPDLGALQQEVRKLALVVHDRPANPADVSTLVGVRHGETIQDFVNVVLERTPTRAAMLVDRVLGQSGMTGVRMVTALGTALLGTALARAESDRGVPRARLADVVFRHLMAARPFGVGSYKVEAEHWAAWSERWSATELRRALRRALATDRALKRTGISDEAGMLRQLVLSFAVPAREVA
jgi:DNA polymerase III delta subunit